MPRTPAADRLAAIAAAATREFGRAGYRGTRTADVARRAGISSGSVFTYVQSKEALFHLVFLHGFGRVDDSTALPIATPEPGETLALIEHGLRGVPAPRMRAALKIDDPDDVGAEIRAIVEERYAIFDCYWPMLAVIERCAVDLPDLEAYYFGKLRVENFDMLARYLDRRAARGHLRAMPDASAAARVVSETITWFAWHRHEGRDAHTYDDDVARKTVVAFIAAALIPEPDT